MDPVQSVEVLTAGGVMQVGLLFLPAMRVEHFQVREVFLVLIMIGQLAYCTHVGLSPVWLVSKAHSTGWPL